MNSPPENERIERERVEDTESTTATVCVVGLGYVGLPLAVGFDRGGYDVIGYDVDEDVVSGLDSGRDTTGELGDETVAESDVEFTVDEAAIARAEYVLVTVPTPVDETNRPSMEYVEAAGEAVGKRMTPGTTVILESTVYPGATREVLLPALERESGLTPGEEFFVGYSPERANPGDDEHGLHNVVKVVSGMNADVREDVAALYDRVIDAGVHRAPSMEVAESAKVIENVQRDVNIALVNELATVFDELGIDTRSVLAAAGTKWNFHDYEPGLVSGHCIPVDPYYLTYRAEREGVTPRLVRTAREVNESMSDHVAGKVVDALNDTGRTPRGSRVLVLGVTYKAGVGDVRSAKIGDVIDALQSAGAEPVAYDPYASTEQIRERFGVPSLESLSFEGVDAVLLATPHPEFENLPLEALAGATDDPVGIVDVSGALAEARVPDGVRYQRV